jgi:hypothetical protein
MAKKIPNPFQQSPIANRGNKLARDIFIEVGYTLSTWEHCEDSFATLYSVFIKPAGNNALARRAYGAIGSTGSRAGMIQFAAEAFFFSNRNTDLETRLSDLLSRYRLASERRAEVAHGIVMTEPNSQPPLYFLMPGYYASRKTSVDIMAPPKYKYDAETISCLRLKFEDLMKSSWMLRNDISNFFQSLPEKQKQRLL